MNIFDEAMMEADDTLFEVFGDDLHVRRGSGSDVPVRVSIERGVAVLGEFGQVTGYVTTAAFRKHQWMPKAGDVLVFPDGSTRELEEVQQNDGLVVKATLYG